MILNSFETDKVLFNILDFPTLIIAMTMDPRVYYLQTHRCQNSDNSNFGYNEIIVKVPWISNFDCICKG